MEGPLNSPVKGAQQARAFYYNLVDAYFFSFFFFQTQNLYIIFHVKIWNLPTLQLMEVLMRAKFASFTRSYCETSTLAWE